MKKLIFCLVLFFGNALYSQCNLNISLTTHNATDSARCDASVFASVTGGSAPISFIWSSANNPDFYGPGISNLCHGVTYTLTVSDVNNCMATAQFTPGVSPCSDFTASVSSTDATDATNCNGAILVQPTGGTAPYYYNVGTTNVAYGSNHPTNLCPGVYTVNAGDSNGCPFSTTVTIGFNSDPCSNFSASATTANTTSPNACDGSVTITATGGTAPYSYNTFSNSTISNLCTGSFTSIVLDSKGCSTSVTGEIFADSIFTFGNPVNDSTVTGTITSLWINNCNIAYDSVVSAHIGGFTVLSADSMLVSWVLNYSNGDSLVVSYPFNLNSGAGFYNLVIRFFCPQKSGPKYLVITSQFNYQLSGIEKKVMPELTVYPNPASDFIYIKGAPLNATFSIVDINGHKLFVGTDSTIDISNISQGSYLMLVESPIGKQIVRFIK